MKLKPARGDVAIGIGGGSDETPGLDAPLALDGVKADEVEGNVLKDGEVMPQRAWFVRAS
jgi:hypothetical protein